MSDQISKFRDIIRKHESYFSYNADYIKQLSDLLNSDPQAGIFEIIMAKLLRDLGYEVSLNDIPGVGGLDYKITAPDGRIILFEATTLDVESINKKSGLSEKNLLENGSFSFGFLTENIRTKLSEKSGQIGYGVGYPVIVAIGSWHRFSNLLLGVDAAKNSLIDEPKIAASTGGDFKIYEISTLSESVFFRYNRNLKSIEPCRRNISVVLFISFSSVEMFLVGAINPDPLNSLDLQYLPEIPFYSVTNYPFKNGSIEAEWIKYSFSDKKVIQIRIGEDDSDLNLPKIIQVGKFTGR